MSQGPELIITEKDNAARRIADILSGGSATADRKQGVNVYQWGGKRCIGLSGHVVAVDFPQEYSDWRDVEPVELIDAPIEKNPTKQNIVSMLKTLARRARRVIIATDYDREGELIGKEAYELARGVNESTPIDRVRFSSITEESVTKAFEDPDELDFNLAAAGEARQIIDLMWGAALTRYLSLSAGQLGNDFISVGRVQGPTLKLIVDRERDIQAFDPDDYWELFVNLTSADQPVETDTDDAITGFEAQYFYHADDGTEAERITEESTAAEVFETLESVSVVDVESVKRRTRVDDPPAPFNTTQFISAAGSIGYAAQRAMDIAEELYTAGYITYPRTDNTVYPDDLDPEELVAALTNGAQFGADADHVLEQEVLSPTTGDEETTDHPPIHPTDELPRPSELGDDEWEVYELVVRHFLATVSNSATWEHLRVVVTAGDSHSLKSNGRRLLDPGYHAVYPYSSATESLVPDVEEGETLQLTDERMEAKQTQPPRRYGQSRLIETMESMGIGTKSSRHNVIEKLYNREYIESDPPRPTQLAHAVVEAAEEFAGLIVSEEMTAQLETDMQAIAEGEETLESVTSESRAMLTDVFEGLIDTNADIGDHLRKSMKADKTLGPCPDCGGDLLTRKSQGGSHFIGCDSYPDCEYTLPLPSTGKPHILETTCDEHKLNEIKMLAGKRSFVHGCPLCEAEAADEQADRVIGACPECGVHADGELAIKQLRSGSRLVGCTRYPDCEYSLPLPRQGEIHVADEICDEHELPALQIIEENDTTQSDTEEDTEDGAWELGCPICNYREYQSNQADSSTLESVHGIGEKTAEKLKDAGVDTVDALKSAEPDTLANRVDGVSVDRLRKWQSAAD
ncbi:DNA topoisomerase I [Haloquadratum walsbyi]|jgi:DNA topoisomerase I (EC 5.99.1.2)|uniref:DNA topoisomerase 1 n=1 Tax=Haloquadratum walsbyi J07HQW2 TaxID=1238425 RepID=U1NGW8_9EURY|nr:DNA topoisomerase I [Haloquadratum walsbyi]ERG96360.1 MAG: Topoisomerase IA [Haloquadratum walsbyi J07HQW2]